MTQSKDTFTFNGFEPANTTPVPDVLFDELLSWLTGSELKVLLYIIRRTRGFKKDSDAISLSQFQKGITTKEGKQLDKGCGIDDRQTIINALASLEEKKCIVSEKGKTVKGDNATTVYRILFSQEVVGKSNQGSREKATTLVGNSNHRSGKKPTTVVGNSNPQETVIQETDKQQTDLQERESTAPESDTPTISPPSVGDARALSPQSDMQSQQGDDNALVATDTPGGGDAVGNASHHARQAVREAVHGEAVSKKGRDDGQLEQNTPTLSPAQTGGGVPEQAASGQGKQQEKRRGSRKPPKPKVTEEQQKRIDRVYVAFDVLMQEVTGNPDACYARTKAATEAIVELLTANPTEERLRKVYLKLWNEPRSKSGFKWSEHMTIPGVCGQYGSNPQWFAVNGKTSATTNENMYGNLKFFSMDTLFSSPSLARA